MSHIASTSGTPPYRIFLSHAGEDKETIARPLYKRLSNHGLSVFLDNESFRLGDDCPEVMEHAMQTAPVGVFVMSPEFVAKQWPMRELLAFVRRYDRAVAAKETPPLLIPIFYRFTTRQCRDTTIFKDHGDLFHRWGLFQRALDGTIPLGDVKHALHTAATLWSIENNSGANNSNSPNMLDTRESFLQIISNSILERLGIKRSQIVGRGHVMVTNSLAKQDVYTSCNMVPPNPPRLTLDYSSPATCEGRLKAAILSASESQIVAVLATGKGGVGKTCALRGLADDREIQRVFAGGILYIQLGNDATVSDVVEQIANIVDLTGGSNLANVIKTSKSVQKASQKASQWFGPRSCLFLVDDIWHVNGIDSDVLTTLGLMVKTNSRMVYTTRDNHFVVRANEVIEFKEKEALGELSQHMLMAHAGFERNTVLEHKNKEAFVNFLTLCQGLPLGLGIVGGSVRRYSFTSRPKENAWSDFHDDLCSQQKELMEAKAETYGALPKIVDLSLQVLEKRSGHGKFGYWFRALCVLQKQQSVPLSMLQKLWDLGTIQETRSVVESFVDVSVVQMRRIDGSMLVQLHDLILDISVRQAKEARETEAFFQTLVRNYMSSDDRNVRDEAFTPVRRNLEDCAQPESMVYNAGARKRPRGSGIKDMHQTQVHKHLRRSESERDGSWIGQPHADIAEDHAEHTPKSQIESEREVGEEDIAPETKQDTPSSGLWHPWWNAEDDGYIHNNLCRILRNAGYVDQLLWLLSQPHWIVKRLVENGIVSVEQDLDHGKAMCSDNSSRPKCHKEHLEMIGRAARLGASFVNKNRRMEEGWFQVHGRLLWHATRNELTKDFVQTMERRAPKPWLKASEGLLQQAGVGALQVVNVRGGVLCTRAETDSIWILSAFLFGTFINVTRYNTLNQFYKQEDLEGPTLPVASIDCASFSPDQHRVVAAHDSGCICVWNRHTGVCEQVVTHDCANHRRFVNFCADGALLACETEDHTFQLWDTLSGKAVGQSLQGHTDRVSCVAVSADGTRIVSGSDDETVRVWDAESGKTVGQPLQGHTGMVLCLALSADGTCIVSGSTDKTVRVWDAESGNAVGQPLQGHTDWVRCVGLSADGTRIVSGSYDGMVCVWDAESGTAVGQPLQGHTGMVRCVALSADGTCIVSGSNDKTVRVWDAESGNAVRQPIQGHTAGVRCIQVSADGTRIVTGSWDGTARVWDAQSGNAVGQPLEGHKGPVNHVAISEDATHVLSEDEDMERLWALNGGRFECVLTSQDAALEDAIDTLDIVSAEF